MEKLINSIKGKLNKEKGLKLIVVLGLIAIALILFSEFIPQKNEEKSLLRVNIFCKKLFYYSIFLYLFRK